MMSAVEFQNDLGYETDEIQLIVEQGVAVEIAGA